jgi:hypothetical protein
MTNLEIRIVLEYTSSYEYHPALQHSVTGVFESFRVRYFIVVRLYRKGSDRSVAVLREIICPCSGMVDQ